MIHKHQSTSSSFHLSASRLISIQGGGYMDDRPRSFIHRPTFHEVLGNFSVKNNLVANSSNANKPISPSSLSLIITCAIMSFAIAEILNYCGIFHDETGLEATRRKQSFLDISHDFDSALEYILDGMDNWWMRNKFQKGGILQWSTWKDKVQRGIDLYTNRGFLGSLQCLSFKHQFAVGSTVGMLCQGISRTVASTTFLVFVASEMLQNIMKDSGDGGGMYHDDESYDDHDDDDDSKSILHRHGRYSDNHDIDHGTRIISLSLKCIQKIRSTIRQSMDAFVDFLNGTDEDFDNSIGTFIVGIGFGLLVKTIF
jgi:hypothetical protein